jgi:cytochrome c
MKKNQTELVIYAIMPRHEMETVSNVYDELLLRKTRNLFSCSNGHTCCEASKDESPWVFIENLHPHLSISDYMNIEVDKNINGISIETVN